MAFIGAAIAGAGAIGGGLLGGKGAKSAAEIQAQAADRANALQEKMYNQNRADQEPWRQAGGLALSQLADPDFKRDFTMADFQQDPGYAFRMAEGQKALERSAAARGGLQSGGTLKALAQYGQNFASNEYGNAYNRFNSDRDRRFNRLSSIAGVGQTATNNLSNLASGYANNVGNNMMGAANAQGAAQMASSNAWGNTLSQLANIGTQYSAMSNQPNWMNKNVQSQSGSLSGLNYGSSPSSFWGVS